MREMGELEKWLLDGEMPTWDSCKTSRLVSIFSAPLLSLIKDFPGEFIHVPYPPQ